MAALKAVDEPEGPSMEDVLRADSTVYVPSCHRSIYPSINLCIYLLNSSAPEMDDKMLDDYLDFCENALLPPARKEGSSANSHCIPPHYIVC